MVKKISRDELLKLINSGEKFKLVDVLTRESFEKEHIKGSISAPLDNIGKKTAKMLKKADKIVVYCASFDCHASTEAAEKLLSMGYKDVLDYKGGLQDYKEANLPMEGSEHKAVKSSCCSCC